MREKFPGIPAVSSPQEWASQEYQDRAVSNSRMWGPAPHSIRGVEDPRAAGVFLPTRGGTAVSKLSVRLNFLQALLAIILGNIVYFMLVPSLPPIARHRPLRIDLGMVLDFWLCLVAYGLIRTARRWR
jgi:hypothetical protein